MTVFSILTLFGGLAFFLYGMTVMSSGLEKMAGGRLEQTLLRMTSNKLGALALGAGITVAIQSSSALTVMLVGLVNSGIMQFSQTICVILGSNVGTTLTAWLLSLTGIESENVFIQLLEPKNFSTVFAAVGILLLMISKSEKKKNVGEIFLGFSVLMFGMTLMSESMSPLSQSPQFVSLLTAFKNPLLALLAGTVFTGIIQSSAASVGILQAMSLTGGITFGMAVPIVCGQNIGTCVTAVLSSFEVSRNAKKVASAHVMFKIIGTVVCLVPFFAADAIFDFSFTEKSVSPVMIAVIHTLFNVINTAILLPFTNRLAALTDKITPGKDKPTESVAAPKLDDRLIATPAVAVASAFESAVEMADLAIDSLNRSLSLTGSFSEKGAEAVSQIEERIDKYEDRLGTYMVKLAREEVTDYDSRRISMLLHTINDFERIGDHACNIVKTAREIHEKKIKFSPDAEHEFSVLTDALHEILSLTRAAFADCDASLAAKVEPLEQVIDKLIYEVKNRHIERLQSGRCTIELGFVLNDLLVNYERVSDHCSNVAVAIIETERGSFETHEYLNAVKTEEGGSFSRRYEKYDKRFTL